MNINAVVLVKAKKALGDWNSSFCYSKMILDLAFEAFYEITE